MNLSELIPDGRTLLAMTPEDLALAVLKCLNASDDNYARRSQRESISLTNFSNQQAAQYPSLPQPDCAIAISAALQHLVTIGMLVPSPLVLNAGIYVLSARAKSLKTGSDYERYRHASRYPRGGIHPTIEQNTYAEFMTGDYETAVFKAFKTLEDAVRTRAELGNESIGVPMMRAAFHPKNGPLVDKSEHEGEREALMHLMAGAIGRFKNPTSHRFTGLDDPVSTIEILQLASLLIRIAEQRQIADA
ncbi:MAG: TIGR02391 family protein [Steroidobacteraceae bacterium]